MDAETKKFIAKQFKQQHRTVAKQIKDSANATAKELKSYVKSVLQENSEELQRYIGALTEDHQHEMSAIGEHYSDIKRIQNEHTDILTANQETLIEHDQLLREILSSLKNIEHQLTRHNQKILALETK